MFNGYEELSKLPAAAFLDWKQFDTCNDHLPAAGYAESQYAKGLRIGRESVEIHISTTSVWSTTGKAGSSFSYEGIGYHSCTDQLLRGFLDSGCKIIVHRYTDTGVADVTIKEADGCEYCTTPIDPGTKVCPKCR